MRILLCLCLLATPALSETPLSDDAFEDIVTGKTLTFSIGEGPYGTEYYAPNRRVIWSYTGGDCVSGEWFEQQTSNGPAICFEYENSETPQCWQVFEENGKIRADYVNVPGRTILYEAIEAEPLVCGGVGA